MSKIKNNEQLQRFAKKLLKKDDNGKVCVKGFVFNNHVLSIPERVEVINGTNPTLNGLLHRDHLYDLHPCVESQMGTAGFLKGAVQYNQLKRYLFQGSDETHIAIAKELGRRITEVDINESLEHLKNSMLQEVDLALRKSNTSTRIPNHIIVSLPSGSHDNFASTGVFECGVWGNNLVKTILDMYFLNQEYKLNLKMVVQSHSRYYELFCVGRSLTYRTVSAKYHKAKSKTRYGGRLYKDFNSLKQVIDGLDFEGAQEKSQEFLDIINKYHNKLFL